MNAKLETALAEMAENLTQIGDHKGVDKARTTLAEIEYLIELEDDKYDDLTADFNSAEARNAKFESLLETDGKFATLRHSHNWEDNTWKPVLHSTEPDILRFLDEAFLEVE